MCSHCSTTPARKAPSTTSSGQWCAPQSPDRGRGDCRTGHGSASLEDMRDFYAFMVRELPALVDRWQGSNPSSSAAR